MLIDECATLALQQVSPAAAALFAKSPRQALERCFDLTVSESSNLGQPRTAGGSCDGMSFLDGGVVLYRPTGNRRENFTLGHELGHLLIDRVGDQLYDRLAEADDIGKARELICDQIARRLLLDDAAVTRAVGERSIEAAAVKRLFDATAASLQACVVALVDYIPCLGAIIVVDRTQQVIEYASIQPDPDLGWPKVYPWPGQRVPQGNITLGLDDREARSARVLWQDSWQRQAQFYTNAASFDARRSIAVLAERDLWGVEAFHPRIDREFDHRQMLEVRCCGETRSVRGYPCSTCGEGLCPKCGNCRCTRVTARECACQSCGLIVPLHSIVDGLCDDCR